MPHKMRKQFIHTHNFHSIYSLKNEIHSHMRCVSLSNKYVHAVAYSFLLLQIILSEKFFYVNENIKWDLHIWRKIKVLRFASFLFCFCLGRSVFGSFCGGGYCFFHIKIAALKKDNKDLCEVSFG